MRECIDDIHNDLNNHIYEIFIVLINDCGDTVSAPKYFSFFIGKTIGVQQSIE